MRWLVEGDSVRVPRLAAREGGNPAAAEAPLERSEELLQELTDPWERSEVLLALSSGLSRRSWQQGTPAEDVVALKREVGDVIAISDSLNTVGWDALIAGDADRAAAYLEEALEIARELRDTFRMTLAIGNLGHVAVMQERSPRRWRRTVNACSSASAAATGAAVSRHCSVSRLQPPGSRTTSSR